MKKLLKKTIAGMMLSGALVFSMPALPTFAANTYYTIDMNTAVAKVMLANGATNQTQLLAGMAQDNGGR